MLWTGLFAPAGTAKVVTDRIALETRRAVQDPQFAVRLASNGIDPLGSTPEEFAATIAKDLIFWRDAIAITGIRQK